MNASVAPPGLPGRLRLDPLRDWAPEIFLLLVTTAAGFWAAGSWVDPVSDAGGWWTLLYRLGRGERLYRDVFLQYGPLSPYLLSFAGRLFGLSPTAFLLMNWVPAVLLGVLLLWAGRPYLTELERFGVLGLVLAMGIFGSRFARLILPYSPAAVHALLFSVLALRILQRDPNRQRDPYVAGALAGLAFCSKPEIGSVALFALCLPVLMRPSRARRWLLPLLGGFCCMAALGLLVVFSSATLESLRVENHFWPLSEVPASWKFLAGLSTGWTLPDWPSRLARAAVTFLYASTFLALCGLLLARDPRVRRRLVLLLLGAMLVGGLVGAIVWGWRADPVCLSMVIAFATALAAFLDRQQPGREFFVAFGIFAGLVAARTAFVCNPGTSYSGVANVSAALTWALFLFCLLPRLLPGGDSAVRITRRLWAFVLLPIAAHAAWHAVQSLRDSSENEVAVETLRGRVWVAGPLAPFFVAMARSLRPGETTLVLPEPNGVEALFELRSVSPWLYHLPGWLDAHAEDVLLKKFETHPPETVVLFARPTWEFGVRPFGQGYGNRLAGWLVRNYQVAVREPGGILLRPRPRR